MIGNSFVTAAFTTQRAAISAGGTRTATCVIHECACSWQRHLWKASGQRDGAFSSSPPPPHDLWGEPSQFLVLCPFRVVRKRKESSPCDPHTLPGSQGGTEHLQSAKKERAGLRASADGLRRGQLRSAGAQLVCPHRCTGWRCWALHLQGTQPASASPAGENSSQPFLTWCRGHSPDWHTCVHQQNRIVLLTSLAKILEIN